MVRTALTRLDADQSGFGIVEVLVASVLLAVGILATISALDGAAKGTYSAQRHEQAISLAQREIEQIVAQPFEEIALSTMPTAVADATPNNPADPRAYIAGTNFMIKRNYYNSAAGPPPDHPDRETLVVDGSSSITPLTQNVPLGPASAGGVQPEATIWRFVTRREDDCALLDLPLVDLCAAEQGTKRITVAVALESSGNGAAPSKPTYLTTVVTDPDAAPLDLPLNLLGL